MVDNELTEKDTKDVSAEELEAVGQVPGIYVDTYWTTRWAGHVRLTFGESIGDKTYYRSAVVMDMGDAKSLRDSLSRVIERDQKREKSS